MNQMRYTSFVPCIAIAALCAVSSSSFSADVTVVDTFGPGNAYNSGLGWGVGGGSASGPTGANYVMTNQFQAGASGILTSIALPVWRLQGSPVFTIEILQDNSGTPGSALVSATASAPDALSIVTTSFGESASVEAGIYYWVSLSTSDPAAALWWSQNSIGTIGTVAFSGALWQQPGEWFYQNETLGAMRLVATAVPEPSAALLISVGGLALTLGRIRRRTRPQ